MKPVKLNLTSNSSPLTAVAKKLAQPSGSHKGIYTVKEGKTLEFTRYGHTRTFPAGFEVEVTYERGEQVLVNFQHGLTLYLDTKFFLDHCTR